MRWQRLFADLSAQWDEADASAERGEIASRSRAELGGVALADRLRGAEGSPVVLRCRGAGQVAGVLTDVGTDWVLVEDARGGEVLVATSAVTAVSGLGRSTGAGEGGPAVRARWDLRKAVRALARERATVQVVLDDGGVLVGTVDRVGADFCELAEHAVDVPRRASAVRGVQAVALQAIVLVRRVAPRLE